MLFTHTHPHTLGISVITVACLQFKKSGVIPPHTLYSLNLQQGVINASHTAIKMLLKLPDAFLGSRAKGQRHKGVHRELAAEARPGGLQMSQVQQY